MLTRCLVKVNVATDRQAHTTTVDVIKVGLTLTHTNYNTLYLCMNTKCWDLECSTPPQLTFLIIVITTNTEFYEMKLEW